MELDTMTIDNSNDDDLNYTISTYETGGSGNSKQGLDCSWLDIEPDSGIVFGGAEADLISVGFNATGLDAGYHTAEILVSSNDPAEPEIIVPVTVHVEEVAKPVVSSNNATDVEEETAVLNGQILDCAGALCDLRGFVWDTESHVYPGDVDPVSTAYPCSWTEPDSFNASSFDHAINGLSVGTKYYFRACAHNSGGWSYGEEISLLTKPLAPAELTVEPVSTIGIDLSWIIGEGAQKTKIQRRQDQYPVNVNDGVEVYFGTGNATTDTGLSADTTYYYRAWSWTGGSEQWSDEYSEAANATASVCCNVTLSQGWNLVSMPLMALNMDLDKLLAPHNLASENTSNISLVYHYDPNSQEWLYWPGVVGGLTSVENGKGYWFYAHANDILTVYGSDIVQHGQGGIVQDTWNMIGFVSMQEMTPEEYLGSVAGDCGLLYCWRDDGWLWWMPDNPASTLTVMQPGQGYWLYMATIGTIYPE
jgi:hypothetical protein